MATSSVRPYGAATTDLVLRITPGPEGEGDFLHGTGPGVDARARLDPTIHPREYVEASGRALPPEGSLSDFGRELWEPEGRSMVRREFGSWLWQALNSDLRRAIQQYLENAPRGHRPRLVLWADADARVAELPWEALGSGSDKPFATRRLLLLRYVDGCAAAGPVRLGKRDKLRVLVLVGNLTQDRAVDDAGEAVTVEIGHVVQAVRNIGGALIIAAEGPVAGLETAWRPDVLVRNKTDVLELLARDGGFHVVHYVGHSDAAPSCAGQDRREATGLRFGFGLVPIEAAQPSPEAPSPDTPSPGRREAEAPADLVSALGDTETRVFVLHTCGIGDKLVSRLVTCVDHVVGMSALVSPEFTELWSGPFYGALAHRRRPGSVGRSVGLARACIRQHGHRESRARGADHEDVSWIPVHWARTLDDQPFVDPERFALRMYLSYVSRRYGQLPGAFTEGIEARDVMADVYVQLDLESMPGRGLEPHVPQTAEWGDTAGSRDGDVIRRLVEGRPTLDQVVRLSPRDDPWITRRWVLRGHPGAGKTTVLQHLAVTLAEEQPNDLVPIYAELQELVDKRIRTPAELARIGEAPEELTTHLVRGRVVLLLDGLDEVDDSDAAHRIIAALVNEFQSSTIVVASREGYEAPSHDFRELWLLGLSRSDRQRLVRNWFELFWRQCKDQRQRIAVWFPGLAVHKDPADATRAAIAEIDRRSARRQVTHTPLGAVLFARLFAEGAEDPHGQGLPVQRHDLYAAMIGYLLECRHRGHRLKGREVRAGTAVVRRLALWMMESSDGPKSKLRVARRHAPPGKDELATFVRELQDDPDADWLLEDLRGRWGDLGDFFDYLNKDAGLFVETRRACAFSQKSFQDALAAQALVERCYEPGRLEPLFDRVRRVKERRQLSAWVEVFALVTGLLLSDDRAEWLRKLPQIDPGLGYRALADADESDEDTLRLLLGHGGSRQQRRQAIHRIADIDDDDTCLAELAACVDATTNGDELWLIDGMLRARAWRQPEHARRATGVMDAQLRKLPCPGGVGWRWCRIPLPAAVRGTDRFPMGSPPDEKGRYENEVLHQAALRGAYWLGATPVTVEQYRAFDPGHRQWDGGERGIVPACEIDPDRPVTNVSWYAARMFCRWLTVHAEGFRGELDDAPNGLVARLPSEAEWEWAARCGTETPFVVGDPAELADLAWFGQLRSVHASPAGRKRPNPFGLYDVHGNVREWCEDWFGPYPEADESPEAGPRRERVVRGGCYWFGPLKCRSAYRDRLGPGWAINDTGFRVALSGGSDSIALRKAGMGAQQGVPAASRGVQEEGRPGLQR